MEVSHRDGKMPELDSLSADLRKAFFLPFFFSPSFSLSQEISPLFRIQIRSLIFSTMDVFLITE